MAEKGWPRVGVVGAGAVGCYFGGMLARAGAPVTLIGRAQHVEAINRDGLFIDSIHFKEHVSVSASTELDAVRDAQLVHRAQRSRSFRDGDHWHALLAGARQSTGRDRSCSHDRYGNPAER